MKKMTGMNVDTVWMPVPMPFASSATTTPGAPIFVRSSVMPSTKIPPNRMSKKSMNALPTFTANQNTRYMAIRKSGIPKMRFKKSLSSLSVRVRLVVLSRMTALAISRA